MTDASGVDAYAFLAQGSVAYLTGLRWPADGGWVERADDAIRACTADELPWWLDDELWEVELADGVAPLGRALTARRARLVRRVGSWTPAAAEELVAACARRVRDRAVAALRDEQRAGDADRLARAESLAEIEGVAGGLAGGATPAAILSGLTADVVLYARDARAAARAAGVAAYIAAYALAGGDKSAPAYAPGFDAERRWQAQWLSRRLGLQAVTSRA